MQRVRSQPDKRCLTSCLCCCGCTLPCVCIALKLSELAAGRALPKQQIVQLASFTQLQDCWLGELHHSSTHACGIRDRCIAVEA